MFRKKLRCVLFSLPGVLMIWSCVNLWTCYHLWGTDRLFFTHQYVLFLRRVLPPMPSELGHRDPIHRWTVKFLDDCSHYVVPSRRPHIEDYPGHLGNWQPS